MRRRIVMTAAGLALVAAACSSTKTAPATSAGPSPSIGVSPAASTPKSSPTAAVTAVLEAEMKGDHVASFQVLSPGGRQAYPDQAKWARRRAELPAITGFAIEGEKDGVVTARVDHVPGLDPFVGLSPAKERQVWKTTNVAGQFLVDPDPATTIVFPPDAAATAAALSWAQALQACDGQAAAARQAVTTLYGAATAPAALCHAAGTLAVGGPVNIAAGPATQDLLTQFGAEVLTWARSVPLSGAGRPFQAVLAPWGDTWRIVGAIDS